MILLCLALTPLGASAHAQQAPTAEARKAWGFDVSDLIPHPAVRFGVLANGMRYAVMRSDRPANGLSVRLRFEAGAMDEEEKEQGHLHLLEHLIFHGSENIPPGALPLMLAHRGMKRLTDFNAVTSYDETLYRLDLAQSDHNARAAAMMVMRDVSSRLSFTRRSVKAAKKDVRVEIASRDALRDRIAAAQNGFFLGHTSIARGPVTGSKASIGRASVDTLRRLYRRHYLPARAILVVVGDFDPALVEAEIASHFADWQGSGGEARADRFAPKLPSRPRSQAYLFTDPAAPTSITAASVSPLHEPDKATRRDAGFLERLGNEMLNRRLAVIAAQPDAHFAGASAATYTHFSVARIASLDIEVRSGDLRRALLSGAAEMRRALDHGFSQAEFDAQLALTRGALVRDAAPRASPALADAIVDAAGRGLVFTEPADPTATAAYLARVRLDEVNAAFNAAWANAGELLFVTHDRPVAGAEAAIAEAWNSGFAQAARDRSGRQAPQRRPGLR